MCLFVSFEFPVAFMICLAASHLVTAQYRWLDSDSFYDCVVGISINGTPSGVGVFIDPVNIITSASPLHNLFDWTKGSYQYESKGVTVHAIDGSWSNSKVLEIVTMVGNQGNRAREPWVKIGLDHLHSTIFDFFIIFITNETGTFIRQSSADRVPYFTQAPFRLAAYNNTYIMNNIGRPMHFAAFGYADKDHVSDSFQLRSQMLEDTLQVNCDEWLPRRWGNFLCIANDHNFLGIQSGAPLFMQTVLAGIGAFELNKGNESVLVFTDAKYLERLLFLRHSTPSPIYIRPNL